MGAPQGVGIGLRRELAEQILRTDRPIDWLEIISENYMNRGGYGSRTLDRVLERWPVASHGVMLSVGGPDPIPEDYLGHLGALQDRLGAPHFSDHLCYSGAHGVALHDLLPLPFTAEAVEHVAARAKAVQGRIGRRFLLENISTYARMPGAEMSEGEFTRAVCEEAGCGLLLDVNNVYVNAINHGEDPLEALLSLPLERTGQIHLAGHLEYDEMLIDDHGHPVCDEVWALYREALRRVPREVATLIEWDLHIPPLDRVLDEADRARAIRLEVLAELGGPMEPEGPTEPKEPGR